MSETLSSQERILEAALALLDEEGEGGLKIEVLAASAHVAKQSIYHHFRDREGLIIAAQAERYRRNLSDTALATLDAMIQCVDADDFAKLLISTGVAAAREGVGRRRERVHSLGSATARPELQAAIRVAHRASVATTEKIFRFGQVRGWVRTEHSAATLSAVWLGTITGLHVAENYADEAAVPAIGIATIDSVSLLLFGRTFPELTSSLLD